MKHQSGPEIIQQVSDYYTAKLNRHGQSPAGVDWNGEHGQIHRFDQLAKILPDKASQHFSVADVGCGYAALYDYLSDWVDFTYFGYDVSEAMCVAAAERLPDFHNVIIEQSAKVRQPVDFVLASGIFNVRLEASDSIWWQYILSTLDDFNQQSNSGFAFNCLSHYSDQEMQRADLYYANALEVFHHCKSSYSHNVALLHDYDLYEFTILVRK